MVTRKLSFLPLGKDSGGAATAVDETTTTTTTADDGKTPGFRVFSFLPKQAHGEAPSSHWHILPEATSPSHGNGPSLEEGTLTVAVGDRAQHSVAHSLPGAFPAGGTSSAFGAQMDIATIVDEEEPPDSATRANLDLNHGLVEARAIGDDDGGNHQNLIRAQEVVDPSASGKRNSPPYQLLLGIGLLFVAALGTVLHQLTNFAELNFVNNNLQGTIPTELALITSMKEIRVGSITGTTSLFGPIPTELGMMTDLSVLWLTRSPLLTGTLPSEFGLLTEMEDLTFSSNSLSSSIPTEVGLLTNVLYFNLYGNLLTGSLPSELGLFSNLKGLFLSRNYLSGTLPSELGLLTDLEQLYLRGNDLSGSVPSELQMLLPDIYDHDLADLPLLTGVDP
ncbi:LRR receptor-like serine threonine-protein kinase [Seminavis robusta]|uniref:LRR receptor-like serine threonine-protein kinase n=1 Tax=Seminavis robusta TaxID=568900 RepID=A0A9N8HLF4_9STRA|nr:LRR receptor-like serine threonine-protein kinase [Seminavis robusta]|eukprot:Sro679_g186070.1 LRR receptor-like serine threonine-protein kinase (392) ;mRNA; r:13766-15550